MNLLIGIGLVSNPLTPTRFLPNDLLMGFMEGTDTAMEGMEMARNLRRLLPWDNLEQLVPPPAGTEQKGTTRRPKTCVQIVSRGDVSVGSRDQRALLRSLVPPLTDLAHSPAWPPARTRRTTLRGARSSRREIRCTPPQPGSAMGTALPTAVRAPSMQSGALGASVLPVAQVGAHRD